VAEFKGDHELLSYIWFIKVILPYGFQASAYATKTIFYYTLIAVIYVWVNANVEAVTVLTIEKEVD